MNKGPSLSSFYFNFPVCGLHVFGTSADNHGTDFLNTFCLNYDREHFPC